MPIWDWCLAAYERPGVPQACLHLQDDYGLSTPLLMWAVWAGAVDPALLATAASVARRWEIEVSAPIRSARRDLKARVPKVDDAAREALRTEVKAVELHAERVLFEALGALAEPRDEDALLALTAACAAWGVQPPAEALEKLSAALH
jgi:uncharacterized protein (TIGR02444 family)